MPDPIPPVSPTRSTAGDPTLPLIREIDPFYAPDPAQRRNAARSLGRLARRAALRRTQGWPADSPGAANAWLLLLTTKPPKWRDPLVLWRDEPPTLGVPHNGFFYPDPLGFWVEVRRWATVLMSGAEPGIKAPEALSVTALLHVGEQPDRVGWALALLRPEVTLFLDEAAWAASALTVDMVPFAIPDPHRAGVAYEGWWGRLLAISVEAGVGFEGALEIVCNNFESPLAFEFSRTLKEMELGLPRREALQNLKRRTEVPELSNFVLALVQADALGMPIGRVLHTQAEEMRIKRRQWARAKAGKLPVKILFPLVMCVFPAVMVVVLGPAVASIGKTFR